jgi:hypothetical protein
MLENVGKAERSRTPIWSRHALTFPECDRGRRQGTAFHQFYNPLKSWSHHAALRWEIGKHSLSRELEVIGVQAGEVNARRSRGSEETLNAAVAVLPDDLACVVNAAGNRGADAEGIVEGSVLTVVVEEAMFAAAVFVYSDDLACVVDAGGNCAGGTQGIVDGGVPAVVVEEAMLAAVVFVYSDDLARVVDA